MGENLARGLRVIGVLGVGAMLATLGWSAAPVAPASAVEPAAPYATAAGVLSDTTEHLFADGGNTITGSENVLPGQRYIAMNGVANPASQPTATGIRASLSWNPADQTLSQAPSLRVLSPNGAAAPAFNGPSQLALPATDPSQYTIEYTDFAFTNDAQRRSINSFDPANGITWVSAPSALPGGMSTVSSVRVSYSGTLAPGATLGIVTPLQRSSSAQAAGTPLPWYFQHGDNSRTVKSVYTGSGKAADGGAVLATDGFLRVDAAWQRVDGSFTPAGIVTAGETVSLKVTPRVFGPLAGAAEQLADSTATITLPNGCLEPVLADLPANATLKPAGSGSDCMSRTPATITLSYGNLSVPTGAPSALGRLQNHVTERTDLSAEIAVRVLAEHPEYAEYAEVLPESTGDSSWVSFDWLQGLEANIARPGQANGEDRLVQADLVVQKPVIDAPSGAIEVTAVQDLDRDGERTASDRPWSAQGARVKLLRGGEVVGEAPVSSNGIAEFTDVPVGSYSFSFVSGGQVSWSQLSSGDEVTVVPDSSVAHQILTRENIAPPELQPDGLQVAFGEPAAVDTAANDARFQPTASGSVQASDAIQILDPPALGSATARGQWVVYTPAKEWPAAYQKETRYTDTLTYSWTNVDGVTSTATVFVLVHRDRLPDPPQDTLREVDGSADSNALYVDVRGFLGDSGLSLLGNSASIGSGKTAAELDLTPQGFLRVAHTPGSVTPLEFALVVEDESGQTALQLYKVRFSATKAREQP